MITQSLTNRRTRLFLALLSIALLAVACGSDSTDDVTTDDVTTNDDATTDDATTNDATTNDDDEPVSFEELGITVEACAADDPVGVEQYLFDDELIFWSHPIFRFHPADNYEPTATGTGLAAPGSNQVQPVAVVDHGLHGDFVAAIIDQMTGQQPALSKFAQPTQLAGTSFFKDTDVAAAIAEVEHDQDNPAIYNLSFGTFSCADKWAASKTRMEIERLLGDGATFVVSAGNSETYWKSWPAALALTEDEVWSVGSLDADGNRSCFSNFGDWVRAWRPGEEVDPGGAGTWSGTSFSAPQLAAELSLDIPIGGMDPPTDPVPVASSGPEPVFPYPLDDGQETFCHWDSDFANPNLIYTEETQ